MLFGLKLVPDTILVVDDVRANLIIYLHFFSDLLCLVISGVKNINTRASMLALG